MRYRNPDTGFPWEEEELYEMFEQTKHESYMSSYDSFEDYIEDQIAKGDLIPIEGVIYQVNFTDPETGETYHVDTVEAEEGYAPELYILDVEEYTEPEQLDMIKRGKIHLLPIPEYIEPDWEVFAKEETK